MRCLRCWMKEKKDVQMIPGDDRLICPVCKHTCVI